jgi:hypothetical protein
MPYDRSRDFLIYRFEEYFGCLTAPACQILALPDDEAMRDVCSGGTRTLASLGKNMNRRPVSA